MKETELLGKLLPGHPDILPIIENIREKYGIPPINPEDDPTEILLTRDDINWEVVEKDIETQVESIPLFDDAETKYIQSIKRLQGASLDFPELDVLDENTKNAIKKMMEAMVQQSEFILAMLEEKTNKPLTKIVLEYLITGKTRDVPEEWFGKVFTMNLLGKPTVFVMAGEGSNPKELAEQFKGEYTRTFGKNAYKITDTQLSTAEYLTMKFQGDSLKRLVERYKEKHPSEFPTDTTSPEYKKTIKRHIDMMEKRLDRLNDLLKKIARDKN